METYRYYPPNVTPQVVPYQIIENGSGECRHELLSNDWCERIMVRDGIVFVVYTCRHCGRSVSQSFDEVLPPPTWSVANGSTQGGLTGQR